MKNRHGPLDQGCARKNNIGPLGLQAVDRLTLRNGLALIKCYLPPNLAQSQAATVNFTVGIARQFFFHGGQGRKGPGNSYEGQNRTIF